MEEPAKYHSVLVCTTAIANYKKQQTLQASEHKQLRKLRSSINNLKVWGTQNTAK